MRSGPARARAAADGVPLLQAAIAGVSAAFASLGRVFLCVDAGFRVLHASSLLDRLIGPGAAEATRDRPVAELLGVDLFGPSGTLRNLLLAGERREGWRATLTVGRSHKPRLVSVTAAPFVPEPGGAFDPRVAYVVVVRPAEEDQAVARAPSSDAGGSRGSCAEVERLTQALAANRWRRAAAARALGISRATLWRRMREAGLNH